MTPRPKLCLNKTLPPEEIPMSAVRTLRETGDNNPNGSVALDALANFVALPSIAAQADRERPYQRVVEEAQEALGWPMPLQAMLYTTKKRFAPGRELKVASFDTPLSSRRLRFRVRDKVEEIEDLFNLSYRWLGHQTEQADVRIDLDRSGGSWSYLGPDVFSIPKDEPTMNFGWFDEDTEGPELNRTARHEFLHNAGLGHEHQNPDGGLKWNVAAILRHYGGPPNNWTEAEVYDQLFDPARTDQITGTRRDPKSIMHYAVPAELLLDPSQAVGWNDYLSRTDEAFLRSVYAFPGREDAA